MSDLLNTLEALDLVISEPGISSADLCQRLDVSDRTLKRYISEMRLLGAQVESVRSEKSYGWFCSNAEEVRFRLHRWIDLERNKLAPTPELVLSRTTEEPKDRTFFLSIEGYPTTEDVISAVPEACDIVEVDDGWFVSISVIDTRIWSR